MYKNLIYLVKNLVYRNRSSGASVSAVTVAAGGGRWPVLSTFENKNYEYVHVAACCN